MQGRSKRMATETGSMASAPIILSDQMLDALKKISQSSGYSYSIRFSTGEALRRRGLVGRHTEFLLKAVYVDSNSSTLQYKFKASAPFERHEWMITTKGVNFLRSLELSDGN
jgi:hypothetical protein